MLGLLKRTSMEFNQTIVMITHNNEIAQLADRIVRIEDGRIVGSSAGKGIRGSGAEPERKDSAGMEETAEDRNRTGGGRL